jgi:single-strand DNA-binding protein
MFFYRVFQALVSTFAASTTISAEIFLNQNQNQIMKSLINKVNLIGNLGVSPQVRLIEGGRKVAKVTLATNEVYKSPDGQRKDETQWHNLVAFGKTAELFERYTKVGTKIAVEGKLVNRSYSGKDGQKKFITEVHVNELFIISNWGGSTEETND